MSDGKWSGFEIAIIGMSGRFPGACNLDQYWDNLSQGRESIRLFTVEELEAQGQDSQKLRSDNFIAAHGVLSDFDLFDAEYFGFSPWEAEILDPQHRLFLETVSSALDDSGYNPKAYAGLIGVFAGASADNYLYQNVLQSDRIQNPIQSYRANYSNQPDFLATRVSYKLGLRGPSFSVQSACSTSLVAIHLACQQLLSGACDMAVAGGVSLTLPQNWGYLYEEGMIMSPDGHCRAFDAEAQGCLKGDGVGAVILKRLADAIEDGDTIDAVVLGSATNNDGDAKVGYAAPGINGQIEVIRSAQMMAEVSPDSITYIEAHGTATPMGDPIEVSALTQVFREETSRKQFCGLGSVKSSFGHLDAAAGIAGFIKTVLALKHRTLPPSLHFKQPNPQIDFSNSPFYVNDQCRDWQTQGTPRRAGVSSFGIGGTNAHLVLEEAPLLNSKHEADDSGYSLFPLSARSTTALEEMTEALKRHLQTRPEQNLVDIASTLQHGRKNFDCRRVMVARTSGELISQLDSHNGRGAADRVLGNPCNVVFLFTGQGSQYVNMARGLYKADSGFRQDIDQCAEILLPHHLDEDIRLYLYPSSDANRDAISARLTCTDMAQPAIFIVEYALARYWMRAGIKPSALIGHSLGELTAACIAGVFSLEDALKLIALRGGLMQSMPSGTMAAVPLTPESVLPYLSNTLSLAAINAPSLCVVSGSTEDVAQLQARVLSDHDLECRQLHTSHAFHSHMMDPTVKPFREAVSACSVHPAKIPIISTITGQPLDPQETQDTEYWARNIRETVQFSKAIGHAIQHDNTVLLEVGPGNTLTSLAKHHSGKADNIRYVTSLRHPRQEVDDLEHLLTSMGQLWVAGLSVDWGQLNANKKTKRVHLPTYPFERKRFWIDPNPDPVQHKGAPVVAKPKPKEIADWFYVPSWKRSALPLPSLSQEKGKNSQRWLIFMDASGIADQFIHQLQEASPNSDVVCVRFGENFDHSAEDDFTIRPDQPDDFEKVIAFLVEADRTPHQILHFSLLFDDAVEKTESLSFSEGEMIQTYGFLSLLHLSQALFQYDFEHPVSLSVISDKSFAVLGNETICPDKITAQAIMLVLPAELESIKTRFIDVVKEPASGKLSQGDLNGIYNEIVSSSEDAVVAFRHGIRWLQITEKMRLEKTSSVPNRLRKNGVYLITGGLGGIGLTLARYLAESLQACLVLVGRQGLPPRSEWESWVTTQGEADPQSKKIRAVEDLERSGARVQVHSADVANEAAMAKVIAEANQSFGEINGVIHAAGSPGNCIIAAQTKENVERVWSAKRQGTQILLSLLREASPDFILLCSSLSSTVGQPGQVDYTAANLYLDAVAQQLFIEQGLPVTTLNWDAWGDVGMALDFGDIKSKRNELILPADGVEVFKRVINQRFPQVFIYAGSLEQYQSPSTGNSPTDSEIEYQETRSFTVSEESPPPPTKNFVALDDDPTNEVEVKMCQIWRDVLGVKRVGVHDNFFELGGDSLVSIQMIARLKRAGIHIVSKQIFQNPTIVDLSKVAEVSGCETALSSAVSVKEDDISPVGEDTARQTRVQKRKERSASQRKRVTAFLDNQKEDLDE